MMIIETHKERLLREWKAMHAYFHREAIPGWFDRLVAAFSEPQRHYHDASHIVDCFDVLEAAFGGLRRDPCLIAAILFHDVVYDVNRRDNEAESAKMWRVYGEEVRLLTHHIEDVEKMINETADHSWTHLSHHRNRVLNDIDMSILSSDEDRYLDYARKIWREYQMVGQDAYVAGRVSFLSKLDPARVYATQPFKGLFRHGEEAVARNAALEIDLLTNTPAVICT